MRPDLPPHYVAPPRAKRGGFHLPDGWGRTKYGRGELLQSVFIAAGRPRERRLELRFGLHDHPLRQVEEGQGARPHALRLPLDPPRSRRCRNYRCQNSVLLRSGVLLKNNMPATIAETVFITSDKEGRLLSDGTGTRQQQVAQALQAGIENYLATHWPNDRTTARVTSFFHPAQPNGVHSHISESIEYSEITWHTAGSEVRWSSGAGRS